MLGIVSCAVYSNQIEENLIKANNAFRHKFYELGISYCDTVLRFDTNNTKAYIIKANNQYKLGDYGNAFSNYMQAYSLNNGSGDYIVGEDTIKSNLLAYRIMFCCVESNFACVNGNENLLTYSLTLVQEECLKYPNDYWLYKILTRFYLTKEDLIRAEEWMEHLKSLDPASYWHYKGYITAMRGNKYKAIEYYKKALEYNPEAAGTIGNIGAIYQELGDPTYIFWIKESARLGFAEARQWCIENNIDW